MSGSHNVNLKPDSLEGKHIDPVGFLASQKTPEDKRKVKSVDIQLDVLKNELEEPDTTSNVRCEVTEDEDRKNLEDKKVVDSAQNNQPQENKESSKYFDHAQSSSTKKSIPTCPCEESVENYLNVRDSTEEPIVDKEKKNEAVNVRENTEEPLVDKEKKDQATQGVDSTSVRSNSVSETSRHTDSSENDFVGTKCKDAQVTLPYTAVNVRENTEEPLDDKEKKNKAVNVRENTEGPLVDKKKKDQATPGVDSTSVRSNSVSETSRHTDSSENDFVGTKCEDAQVTLPYKAVNVRKSTEEPLVDKEKKNKAVNVRENTEEPLVDKEKKDQATPGVDSTSVRSKRVSDTSRHTDSSENDYVGTKCEDAQVTLPYPDKNGPPECIAKLRNAGLYDPSKERTELDVVKNELKEPDATSNVRCEVTDEDRKDLEDKKDVDSAQNNQPPENKETSNYFDQGQPSSQKPCKIKSNPTCLCKECVENCLNVRVNTEGPLVDKEKKNKAVNVRENTEGPLVDKEKKVEATPGVDRTSVRNRRVSDTSRHTDSSENDFVGTKCEDAQVTLPYPDKKGPPECIARLSNAGLYDPSEERTGKTGNKDKISQVAINTSVFVKQPALEKQRNVQKDECDKVDIEKGDPERETLICHTRTSVDQESVYPGFCQCHKACLKLVGSFVLSMLIFPAFLFAAYAWLPFDAPLIPDVPTRLVYTLRCSTFASFPIVLGVIVHGISRLCASSYNPFKPREREVTIHRRFVKQSTFLFVLYFFNLSVLATYLPQKHLKFIPLLTCLFSLSQLIYWLSFAVGRSFRGFGYGLTFLPLVSMLMCNLYFMFVIEPEKMLFLGSRVVPQN